MSERVAELRPGAGRWPGDPGAVRRVRRAGGRDQAQAARVPDRGQAPGRVDRRLRRPRQGQHPAELLRIRTDFLDYTVDRNPYKHGRFTPGTHIPIHPPERLAETRPDYILILPWNLKDEIIEQLAYTREWGRASSPSPR